MRRSSAVLPSGDSGPCWSGRMPVNWPMRLVASLRTKTRHLGLSILAAPDHYPYLRLAPRSANRQSAVLRSVVERLALPARRFGQLPLPVRRDIRAIFSSYRRACEEADVALLAVGEMERVSRAARGSSVGKLTPSAIYVHESALESLPPLLRLYEGCARGYIGRVDGANLVKLHTGEPKVSYLSHPDFESDPHPTLASSMTVHLQTFRVRERDYKEVHPHSSIGQKVPIGPASASGLACRPRCKRPSMR